MAGFSTSFETQLHTADKHLSKLYYPSSGKIMTHVPKNFFEIDGRLKQLNRIEKNRLKSFEEWLTEKKCSDSDMADVNLMALRIREFGDNLLDAFKQKLLNEAEKWKEIAKSFMGNPDDLGLLNIQGKMFDSHVKRMRDYLKRLQFIWNSSKGTFKSQMLTSTSELNTWIRDLYLLPAIFSLTFGFWSWFCTLLFTQAQLPREWLTIMKVLFYMNASQAIFLALYEIYSATFFVCQPRATNYEFIDFRVPSFETQSGVDAKDIMAKCISKGEKFFSPSNIITLVIESDFPEKLTPKLENSLQLVFKRVITLDPVVDNITVFFDSFLEQLENVSAACPSIEDHIGMFKNVAKNLNTYVVIAKSSDDLDDMVKSSVDGLRTMKVLLNDPVNRFNNLVHETNFDCKSAYNAYKHGSAVNFVAIEYLKMMIIGGSALLSLLHLFYLRRSDTTQFWNDPRQLWCKKYMNNNVDDEQHREWKRANTVDPPGVTYQHFTKRKNKKRNRFSDIGLIDQSRVVLTDHETDYIHASRVSIPNTNREYIACQAPMPNTYKDFWRMLIQEKVKIVIFLSGFIELDRRICDVYFPYYLDQTEKYGKYKVTCVEMMDAPKYTGLWLTERRLFEISDLSDPHAPSHFVTHIYFQSWYFELVPKGYGRVTNLQRYVEELVTDDSPITVMCHAGNERTGCYIAMDYMYQQIIRGHCPTMVEVSEHLSTMLWGVFDSFIQFIFIYPSLTYRFVLENVIFEEDYKIPFRKYVDAMLNRCSEQDNYRARKNIEIQYWKYPYDPR